MDWYTGAIADAKWYVAREAYSLSEIEAAAEDVARERGHDGVTAKDVERGVKRLTEAARYREATEKMDAAGWYKPVWE